MSRVQQALLAIAAFTGITGFILYSLGLGDHHANPLWALGTSIIFLIILLIDVWMIFAISGEDAFKWDPDT